jgi:hypothetical protein
MTHTGKTYAGMPAMKGSTRQLNAKDLAQQKRNLQAMQKANVRF